jgi:hypothetical protein
MTNAPVIYAVSFPVRAQPKQTAFDDLKPLRQLIWLYIILWLVEGGLRRWFLPGLSTPLLLIRDPVAIAIYSMAMSRNIFPYNTFISAGILLAALTFFNAVTLGHGNLFVALYGVRCDFLHVPMIFVMGKVLRKSDLMAMAKVALWIVIPYTMLLVAQFYQPQDAWVNRGVGGDMEGAGFYGAMDHFRPPGTFSFITGPSQLYPIIAACWFLCLLSLRLPIWLIAASGAAILVAIPISISRSFFLAVAIVAAMGVGAMIAGGRLTAGLVVKVAAVAVILAMGATQLTAFKDSMEAFSARWEVSTTNEGGFQEAIVDRVIDGMFGSFDGVTYSGYGTGYSTNVGQKMLTEAVGFGASEGEWGRLLYDDGFVLGGMLIVYRVLLAGAVLLACLRAWRRSPEALVFASAAFILLLNGQWGQATTLGSAVIAGGLALAATNTIPVRKLKSASATSK